MNNAVKQTSDKRMPETRVINGRLYIDTGKDNIYHAVPRGMDDARDVKTNPVPEYVVKNNKEYQIVDGKQYMDNLQKNGEIAVSAQKNNSFSSPQYFVQVNQNVAVMCPLGENGRLIPQTIDKGGFITKAQGDDYYGIAAEEFTNTYTVLEDKTVLPDRENPGMDNQISPSLDDLIAEAEAIANNQIPQTQSIDRSQDQER